MQTREMALVFKRECGMDEETALTILDWTSECVVDKIQNILFIPKIDQSHHIMYTSINKRWTFDEMIAELENKEVLL